MKNKVRANFSNVRTHKDIVNYFKALDNEISKKNKEIEFLNKVVDEVILAFDYSNDVAWRKSFKDNIFNIVKRSENENNKKNS